MARECFRAGDLTARDLYVSRGVELMDSLTRNGVARTFSLKHWVESFHQTPRALSLYLQAYGA